MQFNVFYFVVRFIRVGIALLFLAGGYISRNIILLSFLFVVMGLVLLTGAFTPYQNNARKMKRQLTNGYPQTEYRFKDNVLIAKNQYVNKEFGYNEVQCVFEDSKYYYLFMNNTSAHMIDKKTIENAENFGLFLVEKTGCKIKKGFADFWKESKKTLWSANKSI